MNYFATWTQRDVERLKIEWRKGVAVKILAHEFGRTEKGIKDKRRALGLPVRKVKVGRDIRLRMSHELHDKSSRRACERGLTYAAYIRSLVMRDIT